MDAVLSHALAASVGTVPTLLGAVTYFVRARAKNEEKIADAVVKAMADTRTDMDQAKAWAREALTKADEYLKSRDACEKRCDHLQNEMNDLRREMRSGHRPR